MMLSTNSEDRAGVLALNDALRGAWNAHDADAFAAAWLDDADHVNVLGDVLIGSEGVRNAARIIFAGMMAESHSEVDVRSLRFLAPDVAVLDLNQTLTGVAGPPGGEVRSRIKIVLQRIVGMWRVASFQNTEIRQK